MMRISSKISLLYYAYMNKETILGGAVVLILLGGIVFYTATKPSPAKAPGAVIDVPHLSGASYTEKAPYYEITANYASSTPLLATVGPEANATAVGLMKKFVSDTITAFKTDGNFAHLSTEDVKMMGFDKGRKETLQIMYLIASSAHTITYIYTINTDTLGAHGNTSFKTFTFDTKTGAELSLKSISKPDADYLTKISLIARTRLAEALGKGADLSMLTAGTQPDDTNFASFFFDNEDFVILFAPYQVAPYALGPQTLRIPLSELSDVIRAEYR